MYVCRIKHNSSKPSKDAAVKKIELFKTSLNARLDLKSYSSRKMAVEYFEFANILAMINVTN